MGEVVSSHLFEDLFADEERLTLGGLAGGLEQAQRLQALVVDAAGKKLVQGLTEGQIFDAIIVIEAMFVEVVVKQVVAFLHPVDAATDLPHRRVLAEAVNVKILGVFNFHTRTGFLVMSGLRANRAQNRRQNCNIENIGVGQWAARPSSDARIRDCEFFSHDGDQESAFRRLAAGWADFGRGLRV